MAEISYTAKRNLKSGHSAGTDYTIDISIHQEDGDTPKIIGERIKSLAGNEVTVLHRIERYLDITTDYVRADGTGTPDVADFREFFDSVAGGETFSYDNGEAILSRLVGDPTRSREGILFNYRFKLRIL